ncbi:olfactory receptor 13F1-like [Microcaecilia unicolor]|uniref:Olfactory receptor 13F1-like n=1 Tax=Microcaecilia unicolor TaxID=1415580 RepID=A0A6P7X139_9AMPH|nr:olfactory receptor 13F1-like [Microcaecilia unicolor]
MEYLVEHNYSKVRNHSSVTEFLILGFSEFPELQILLFAIFLLIYVMAVLENLLIICIICSDQHLHTPMYFLLANLSALDIFSMTSIIPKLLVLRPACIVPSQHCMDLEYSKGRNYSTVTEFMILGFSELPELQLLLFALFSLLYLITVLENVLIICIVCADQHLHIPMYFFLANLSALDIFSLNSVIPKLLVILLTNSNNISVKECIIQMYCYAASVGTEYALLTAMAYDRYVAICNPLRYTLIMNKRVCAFLAAASWMIGLLEPLPHYFIISQFCFCDSNVINHVFCEVTVLQKLSCTDTSVLETINLVEPVLSAYAPFILTLTSYVFIISTILKIRSREGKSKAFSTCSSHLTVILLAYGTMIGVYMQPESVKKSKSNKLPTALYVVTLPLLNPLIYSLRSKELKVALKKVISRKSTFVIQ